MSRMMDILHILRKNEIVHGLTPEKLKTILEELGPTFIKFGQILSMRPDVIPDEYCRELAKLRTNVEPMDFSVVSAEIEQECGRSWTEVFSDIQKKPLGSASIGQVHKARLLDGTDVVIKIQRPNIKQIMQEDIKLCRINYSQKTALTKSCTNVFTLASLLVPDPGQSSRAIIQQASIPYNLLQILPESQGFLPDCRIHALLVCRFRTADNNL